MKKPVVIVDYPTEVENAYEPFAEPELVVPESITISLTQSDISAARGLSIYPSKTVTPEVAERLLYLGLASDVGGGYVRGPCWNKLVG